MIEIYELNDGSLLHILPRGGDLITKPFIHLDDTVIADLEKCATYWPYENKEAVERIISDRARYPQTERWVACETSFFSNLPEYASRYAIPDSMAPKKYRRFGASGLYHEWIARTHPGYNRVVSVYIGEQMSAAAILNGEAVETSSGYSGLEGLPGQTTCGELDPSIPLLLAENGFSPEEIEKMLYCRSGWQALAGKGFSISQLLTANDGKTEPVLEIFFSSLIKAIGGMTASLGGVDAVVIGSEKEETGRYISEHIEKKLAFLSVYVICTLIDHRQIARELSEKYCIVN